MPLHVYLTSFQYHYCTLNSQRLQFTYIYLYVYRIKKLNETHHQKPLNLLASFTICILLGHKHNSNFSCGCASDLQNKISPMRFTDTVQFFWARPFMFVIKYLMTPILIGFLKKNSFKLASLQEVLCEIIILIVSHEK